MKIIINIICKGLYITTNSYLLSYWTFIWLFLTLHYNQSQTDKNAKGIYL